MVVRNVADGGKLKEEFLQNMPNVRTDVMAIDLNSMDSVQKFASAYISPGLPLNILINNAGIIHAAKFMFSKDNIEQVFAVNHLGQFLLTNLLLDTMKMTARESQIEGRIINLSSDLYRRAVDKEGIVFYEINDEKSNNAGTIPAAKFTISKDNIEQVFAVNLLGQFLLTNLLLDTMKKTSRESQSEGRIINLSSDLHRRRVDKEGIAFDKINDEKGNNVGTIPAAKFTISKDNIEQVFTVNLLGMFSNGYD
ncbi:hypothetical protein AgCh_000597 [Apium graveolens]